MIEYSMDMKEHADEIQSAQLEQILKSIKYYLPVSMILATLLAAVQYSAGNHPIIISWLATLYGIALLRSLIFRHFLKSPLDNPAGIRKRLLILRLCVFAGGITWGAAGYLLFPHGDPQHQIFLIFMLAGLSAGGLISYSADFGSAAIYAVTAIFPLSISLYQMEGNLSEVMSLSLLLYLIFIIMFLRQLSRNITNNIQMRIETRLAKDEIIAGAERYRLLLKHSPVGIFHFDKDMQITYCNEIIVTILHSSTDIIEGLDMHILKDQSLVAPAQAALAGNIGRFEGKYEATFSNLSLWISLICAPSRNSAGDIIGGIGIVQDLTERKEAADEIRKLAFFDPLTSLPNRRQLMDWLKQAMLGSSRNGKSGALLFINLDNFNNVNETCGHDTGDLLLQQSATRIVSCVRESDTVSRTGGDEFLVILESLNEDKLIAAGQAETIAEKIRLSLNQPFRISPHVLHITSSIGVTLFRGSEQKLDDILKQSDIAMHEAKYTGRNSIRFFDPVMQDAVNNRALLLIELNKALENNELELYYQVQVDNHQQPVGAETLLRWIHPRLGMISPVTFIPLAEETGLIIRIGQWVIETACEQVKRWQTSDATQHLVLAVNISAKQFRQPDFTKQLRSTLNRHAIHPGKLKLEITESVVLDNIERIIHTMSDLKEIGIQFSLDDFGTGYSSLQYLKRLPLDQLKIDKSFVRDLVVDTNDQAIVSTIIAMAHSLHLDVIAEGVESAEQAQFLLQMNCCHFQGYLFGKPVALGEFEKQLAQFQVKSLSGDGSIASVKN